MVPSEDILHEAEAIFRANSGMMRTSAAIEQGVHPRTLYALRDRGRLVQISRGVYRLADLPELSDPDLVTVATRVPEAVVCLISALCFHDITTEIPHEVHIALPRQVRKPKLDYPPLRVYHFSGPALEEGIETRRIDGARVRIYGPEKTIADCFKYRNQIGLAVALEALRLYLKRQHASRKTLLAYARICRVEKVMLPYLEALQ